MAALKTSALSIAIKANDEILKLKEQLEAVRTTAREQRLKLKDLETEITELKDENNELVNDMQDVITENDELRLRVEESMQMSSMLTEKGHDLREERDALIERLELYDEELQRTRDEAKQKAKADADELAMLKLKVKQVIMERDGKEHTINKMNEEHEDLKMRLRKISEEMIELQQHNERLKSQRKMEPRRKSHWSEVGMWNLRRSSLNEDKKGEESIEAEKVGNDEQQQGKLPWSQAAQQVTQWNIRRMSLRRISLAEENEEDAEGGDAKPEQKEQKQEITNWCEAAQQVAQWSLRRGSVGTENSESENGDAFDERHGKDEQQQEQQVGMRFDRRSSGASLGSSTSKNSYQSRSSNAWQGSSASKRSRNVRSSVASEGSSSSKRISSCRSAIVPQGSSGSKRNQYSRSSISSQGSSKSKSGSQQEVSIYLRSIVSEKERVDGSMDGRGPQGGKAVGGKALHDKLKNIECSYSSILPSEGMGSQQVTNAEKKQQGERKSCSVGTVKALDVLHGVNGQQLPVLKQPVAGKMNTEEHKFCSYRSFSAVESTMNGKKHTAAPAQGDTGAPNGLSRALRDLRLSFSTVSTASTCSERTSSKQDDRGSVDVVFGLQPKQKAFDSSGKCSEISVAQSENDQKWKRKPSSNMATSLAKVIGELQKLPATNNGAQSA